MIEKELTPDFPPVGYDQWRSSVVAEMSASEFQIAVFSDRI
jgi:hypothetical protein